MGFLSDVGYSDLVERRESSSLREHIDSGSSVEEVLDIINLDGIEFGEDVNRSGVIRALLLHG